MDKEEKIIRLATCGNSYDANILRLELENNGIACMLGNENMSNLYGGLLPVLGVDVYVFEKDGEMAAEIYNRVFMEEEAE
ncbi:MAG: DUF2007 domain-containing protein [Bacteroidaceae bacterium]|nr:DUF2007 domain-containing protein [Bacteroidaceae bacterium]